MTGRSWARRLAPFALGALLTLGLAGASASLAQQGRWTFTGSCYCKAAGELRCVADQTEDQCRRRCAQELCDDWFWLERRPCWNWGYGG